ncbi:MAG TPA: hydroxylamine reductase [Oscillospiraceae bacterium]|nr:hydroxylamine reductase [Oscillospiraceae bacterium]
MFCNQCEQTAKGIACTAHGVCGKDAETSALQDLLLHAVTGLSLYAVEARKKNTGIDSAINQFTVKAIFSTLTNVDFDPQNFANRINQAVQLREQLKNKVEEISVTHPAADFTPAADLAGLIAQGTLVNLTADETIDPDLQSLQQILLYGLKGVSAYADHALTLGQEDEQVYTFVHEAMASFTNKDLTMQEWLQLVLKCGEINFRAMELLDAANTSTYGHPVPTPVPLGHRAGKAILVSGHDLKDLAELLKQTEGTGINIYTHGEMLPTHGYPELKKYPHFYGHFGTAWQNQQKEFADFPGAILMTTNCLQKPQPSYADNIFTAGNVGWPGIQHIEAYDFSPVINKALELPGFTSEQDADSVTVGFARKTVLGLAPTVIEAVKSGAIKHFFLVGGCDGIKADRNYYAEFVEKTPQDSVILTLACGKFRFFDKQLGDIGGIPRLLDVGQCNDAYSAIQIALALAEAFDCGVNDLPLTLVLSWYEQKAIAILLTLLHLGIKDILIGPSLPAFITPNVLNILVEQYNLRPISTPEQDLAMILG